MSHTKGLWWATTSNEIVTHPDQVKIANNISGSNPEEAKANARLIAASPFMLERLKGILKAVNNGDVQLVKQMATEGILESISG